MSNQPKPLDFGSSSQPNLQKAESAPHDPFANGLVETSVSEWSPAPAVSVAVEKERSTYAPPVASVAPPRRVISEDDIRRLGMKSAGTSAAVSERLLSAQRMGDGGEMGGLLNNVIHEAKGLSPEAMANKGLIGKVKGLFGRVQDNFMARYDTVQGRIDTMVKQLDVHVRLHEQRVRDLEDLRKANYQFYLALKEDVATGEEMLIHVQEMIDYAKAQDMTDGFAANKVTEYEALYNMLEKRIDDFRRVMVIAQQTEPQLVLMKVNSHDLVDNFNTVKNTTIPIWRQMFSQYLIALDQKRGAALSKSINDSTDEALRKNAELLGQNAVNIAEARQRSVVSIERLEETQRKLFETLDKVAEIERKGRDERKAAQPRLKALEEELVARFASGQRR